MHAAAQMHPIRLVAALGTDNLSYDSHVTPLKSTKSLNSQTSGNYIRRLHDARGLRAFKSVCSAQALVYIVSRVHSYSYDPRLWPPPPRWLR